ncbi:DUF5668 domain-containing protein [Bacillaceae bacterium S4-13-56]
MKKQNSFVGMVLIGIGAFFLLKELALPLFTNFYSWPTIVIIIGISMLLHSYMSKQYSNLLLGAILFGIGVHFHMITYYSFWPNHWGMVPLIIGLSFLVQYQKAKKGLIPGLILLAIALMAIFSTQQPGWFQWIHVTVNYAVNYWPILLIIAGFYFIYR